MHKVNIELMTDTGCDEQWTFNQRELDYVIKFSFVLI